MISDVIRTALAKGKKKQTDLATVCQCKPAVIYSKMQRSSWSASDLARVADTVGAQLVFVFPDGELLRILEDRPVARKKAKEDKTANPALPKERRSKRKKKSNDEQYEQMALDLPM